MNSSTINNSNCLIDLSQEESFKMIQTSMNCFPPTDEMIVKPFGRMSMDNNPFDTAEKQANLFDDPFEVKQIGSQSRDSSNSLDVPTGSLIEVDDEFQADIDGSQSRQINSSNSLSSISSHSPHLNNEYPTASQISSICVDVSDKDCLTNASSPIVASLGTRNRIQSDPDAKRLTKTKRKMDLGKTRSTSLDQLFLKNQILKKLSNSPLGSPNWQKVGNDDTNYDNSMFQEGISIIQKLANASNHSACDDLMSTKPEWIDSENEDSDIECMTIPFLKNIGDNVSITEANDESTTDRENIIEKLSKYKKIVSETTADTEEKMDIVHKEIVQEIVPQTKTSLISMIDTLRDVVNKCVDEKSKGEASTVLDNLNIYLSCCTQNISAAKNHVEPKPIIRQRTFSMERQSSSEASLDEISKMAQLPVVKELDKKKPATNPVLRPSNKASSNFPIKKRNSFSSSIPSTPTSSRLSRSFSHTQKTVCTVSTVSSSPSLLMRRSSISTPTRSTTVNRRSLTPPKKEPNSTLPKQISRKTIMKPSHPLPRTSNIAPKALKLRVGEQTKPIGPLKAVIPYESISSLKRNVLSLNRTVTNDTNTNDVSADVKKCTGTSTPILSSIRSQSGLPTASSTPVIDNPDKLFPRATHLVPNRSRLSYVPTTPKSNLTTRQPATERKRSVTFNSEVDNMSMSMIDGGSTARFTVPIPPLQRKRLSRSNTNKENTVLRKK